MKTSATHSGHCQACGRLQKLPNGKLSLHGYTVTHGFFSGTCRGASYLPFELSCDQVQRYITEAQESLRMNEEFCQSIRARVGTQAFVSNYEKNPRTQRSGYVIREVEIVGTEHPYSDGTGSYWTFTYDAPGYRKMNGENETHKVDTYATGIKSPEDAAHHLNDEHAKRVERTDIKMLKSYIKWQTERVTNWKPAALLPVTAKDKLGFKIEEGK